MGPGKEAVRSTELLKKEPQFSQADTYMGTSLQMQIQSYLDT